MTPDYEIEGTLEVSAPAQLRAIGDETRLTILDLLAERAATTSQLAEALGRPRGSVGHHVKVLESAGLVRVVRTRPVRGLTAKYYGRTARTFLIHGPAGEGKSPFAFLERAMREAVVDDPPLLTFTLRHARIPDERAAEFVAELTALAESFAGAERGGDTVFGFVGGVFATDLPSLSPEEEDG